MDSDALDFSIGLAPSLELLKRYKRSGILQARVARIPNMREEGLVRVYLVNGEAVACEVKGADGQARPIRLDVIMQLDEERGPFEWTLHAQPAPPPVAPPQPQRGAPITAPLPIPLRVSPPLQVTSPIQTEWEFLRPRPLRLLDFRLLGQVSSKDRMILHMVFSLVDGQRTINEIKARLSLSSGTVDEALRTLQQLGFITFH